MALDTHHVKDCVCVCIIWNSVHIGGMKSCKGQSVKHITINCSKHGSKIILKFCTRQSPKLHTKTSK